MTDITGVMNNIKNLFGDDVSFRVDSESNCEILALRTVVHSIPIDSKGNVTGVEPDVLVRSTVNVTNYLDSNGISYIVRELRAASTVHSCQVIADRITVEYFNKYLVAQKVGVNKFELFLNYSPVEGRANVTDTLNWFYEHITGNVYPAVLDAFILPEVPALPIDMEKAEQVVESGSVDSVEYIDVTWKDLYPTWYTRWYARSIYRVMQVFKVSAYQTGHAGRIKRLALFKDYVNTFPDDTLELKEIVYHRFLLPYKKVDVKFNMVPIMPAEHIVVNIKLSSSENTDE